MPERRTYEKRVGEGTLVTLIRLGLLEEAEAHQRVILSEYAMILSSQAQSCATDSRITAGP